MVFYLKYRPQKIKEIDNIEIRKTLEQILSTGKPPHALLFAGPKGTGKTSGARIVAKSLNCLENEGKGEPCSKCEICQSIAKGTNLDVLEIDAASNRGIDEIRHLRQRIKLAPSLNRKKVYIVDEVHMLTREAFNALLKTLEEPPPHAYFILATTQKEKLPDTILSRCLLIRFKKASIEDIISSLKRIVKGENLRVERKALEVLAKFADGSFRDAAKVLEQASIGKTKVTSEDVKKILGIDRDFKEEDLIDQLVKKDAKKALLFILKMREEGLDLQILTKKILNTFHKHLLKKYGIFEEDDTFLPSLERLTVAEIKVLIELFSKAAEGLKTTVIPELPLELAVVEWVEGKEEGNDKNLEKKLGEEKKVFENWGEVIKKVKHFNHSMAGVLRGCSPKSFTENTLYLETLYKFHYERLSDEKIRKLLEKIISEVSGRKIKVKIGLKKGINFKR